MHTAGFWKTEIKTLVQEWVMPALHSRHPLGRGRLGNPEQESLLDQEATPERKEDTYQGDPKLSLPVLGTERRKHAVSRQRLPLESQRREV